MTSACRPGEDRKILKLCWVESVTEKQKASTAIDTKRTRAEAILYIHTSAWERVMRITKVVSQGKLL